VEALLGEPERKKIMEDDDRELNKVELQMLDDLDDIVAEARKPSSWTAVSVDPHDEDEWNDRLGEILDDKPARVSTSVSWLPVLTAAIPAEFEISVEAAHESTEIGPSIEAPDTFERVPLRSTERKAGKFLPNCFGSQFLHDAESSDCRPCKYIEGCKKTIVSEIPLLEAARKARREHFGPSGDPKQRNFMRGLLRTRHLVNYRKAQKERRRKDLFYRRDKRANPNAELLIATEAGQRLSALRDAVVRFGKDKFLQQLRGREALIMAVWESEQHAHLAHGPTVSAAQVAKTFNEMIGDEGLSRHQARTYQGHFRKLEQLPHVWKRFVKSPDDKIA
jgi:hypothetical protein